MYSAADKIWNVSPRFAFLGCQGNGATQNAAPAWRLWLCMELLGGTSAARVLGDVQQLPGNITWCAGPMWVQNVPCACLKCHSSFPSGGGLKIPIVTRYFPIVKQAASDPALEM